jgi:type II secretory ATPase GspE/PulE/Tfp pilus assembly ATPase PilB-like protein
MIDGIATLPPLGGYVSVAKVIFMLVLVAPWLAVVPWVHKDARRLHGPQMTWIAGVLGAGVLGIIVWLIVSFYAVGLVVYVVLTAATVSAYVVWRDAKVDLAHRVFSFQGLRQAVHLGAPVEQVVIRVKVYDCRHMIVTPPEPQTASPQQCHTYNLAQEFLSNMRLLRVGEAEISPANAQRATIRFVIDGVSVKQPSMLLAEADAMIQYFKSPAGMDPAERRRPQEGHISVDLADKAVDVTVNTTGTTGGQQMRFRVTQEIAQTRLDQLGMTTETIEWVRIMCKRSTGLIIVSGPDGSGVTSTLYSLLGEEDAFLKELVTLEAEPAIDLENVTQNVYASPQKLGESLGSVLRRGPDVVMVDRCEDTPTAKLICRGAEQNLMLVGMRAGDSFTALARWIKVCGQPERAMDHLCGVLCQLLVRKLCPVCREAYRPDPQLLAKANIPAEGVDRFYRSPKRRVLDPKAFGELDENGNPIVCSTCHETGYSGRTGVFELLRLTDELRQLVLEQAPLTQIRVACRKNNMHYIQENALRKVIEGTTSVQEVIRVTPKAPKS